MINVFSDQVIEQIQSLLAALKHYQNTPHGVNRVVVNVTNDKAEARVVFVIAILKEIFDSENIHFDTRTTSLVNWQFMPGDFVISVGTADESPIVTVTGSYVKPIPYGLRPTIEDFLYSMSVFETKLCLNAK